ncbi:mCG1042052, partial [Mus musculus]
LVKNKGFIVSSKITENSSLKTTTLTETHSGGLSRRCTLGVGMGAVQSAGLVLVAADSQSYRGPSERRATRQLQLQRAKDSSPEKAPPNATLASVPCLTAPGQERCSYWTTGL